MQKDRKVRENFAFFPVTQVRNPTDIVQKDSFRLSSLFWVDFSGWIILRDLSCRCNVARGNVTYETWRPQPRSRNAMPSCSEKDISGFQHVETWRIRYAGNAKLSTTTAREQNRALGPQVYSRYPNPGKHRASISTIAFAGSAKIWAPRGWIVLSYQLRGETCRGVTATLLRVLKFRRVTIRGAQPSARLSEEICLSEGSAGSLRGLCGGLSEGSAGLSGVLRGSAGFSGGFRGSDPMLVTLGNCWNVLRAQRSVFEAT